MKFDFDRYLTDKSDLIEALDRVMESAREYGVDEQKLLSFKNSMFGLRSRIRFLGMIDDRR